MSSKRQPPRTGFHKASVFRAKDKEILVLRLKTESDQYKLVMQTKMNEEIIFGSEVLFKHIDSDQFLLGSFILATTSLGSYKCSEFSTDAFKLELTKYLSSQAIFKIQPYHSY
jgi:inositol 1,4,5-triphosphate receptor type 1/inositol 1,4,5-triphosphate receptor type 3